MKVTGDLGTSHIGNSHQGHRHQGMGEQCPVPQWPVASPYSLSDEPKIFYTSLLNKKRLGGEKEKK